MELVCTVTLVLLSLCQPGAQAARSGARLEAIRVNPGADLLGRQVAVAPAVRGGSPWGDPRRLAFCGPDGIQRTLDGGGTWSLVPTDGVVALAADTEMPLAPRLDDAPACQSVLLDPHEPDTFYAVFRAVKAPQTAPPPSFAAGYVTQDVGQSWQPVPAPANVDGTRFGGFVANGAAVQALFGPQPASPSEEIVPPLVMATTDGGRSWQQAQFDCPIGGPCVRWGAPPTAIGSCNMRGYGQPLLLSEDGGQTWRSPVGARVANACRPNELVVVSDRDVLLLAPGGGELDRDAAPVRISRDGGRTFAAHTLPPGPAPDDLFELYLLPDERLLARVSGPMPEPGCSWQILWHDSTTPAQDRWCPVAPVPLPTSGAPLRVAGDRLWWLAAPGQPASLALADLRCGGPGADAPSTPAP